MAPSEITDDYYALLEVSQTATLEIIRKSYRRLAVVRHPDKNPTKPDATAAFQLLLSAYQTLSDLSQRRAYDVQWEGIRSRLRTQQEAKKSQAEATERERKKAAEETLNRQREQKASDGRLEGLRSQRSLYDSEIFELERVIRKLEADLKRIHDLDGEESRKERERNSWFTYFTRPIYGKQEETEAQRQQRDLARLQRRASESIKSNELNQKKAKLQGVESALKSVHDKISAENKKTEEAARAEAFKKQEQLRREQEAKRRKEEQEARERLAKWQAELAESRRKEAAARAAKEAREAQEARMAQERAREAREAEAARQMEAFRKAAATRQADAARRRNRTRPATASNSSYPASAASQGGMCRHRAFWQKLEGSHLCSECHVFQRRFAFQCPGCQMVACAGCRQTLRGEKKKENIKRDTGSGYSASQDESFSGYYDWD